MSTLGLHLTPIGNGDYLLEPSRGLDISQPGDLVEEITRRLQNARATRLYYDLSELALIDPLYYTCLNTLARACQAVNVKMVCIHMQPTAAYALAQFITETPVFETAHEVEGWKQASR